MTTKTIQTVATEARLWTAKDGSYTLAFIEGMFTDGTSWSYAAKPETAQKRLQELKALVGKESDFTLEAKGEYNGIPQFKIKVFEGGPQPRQFGGGGLNDEQIELLAQRVAEQVVGLLNGATPAQPAAQPSAPAPGGATLKQVKAIKELANSLGINEHDLKLRASVSDSLMEMDKQQADKVLASLTADLLNGEEAGE